MPKLSDLKHHRGISRQFDETPEEFYNYSAVSEVLMTHLWKKCQS